MSFKEDYDRLLRRVCGVTDDTLKVTEDSDIRYGGGCETCAYEYQVVIVTVWKKGSSGTGWKKDTIEAEKEFDSWSTLINALDKIDKEEKKRR